MSALSRWAGIWYRLKTALQEVELTLTDEEWERLRAASRRHWPAFFRQFTGGRIVCTGPPGPSGCLCETPHSFHPEVRNSDSAHMHLDHQPSLDSTVRLLTASRMLTMADEERSAWWDRELERVTHRLVATEPNPDRGWPAALAFRCGQRNFGDADVSDAPRLHRCHPTAKEQRRIDRMGGLVFI